MLRSRHEQHRELGINLIDNARGRRGCWLVYEFQRIDVGEILRARV
jgi:hypothetical protein